MKEKFSCSLQKRLKSGMMYLFAFLLIFGSVFLTSAAFADNVACIGSNCYTTLQAAFDAAQSGQTVMLITGYDATNSLVDSNFNLKITKSITVDGNGNRLKVAKRGIQVKGSSSNVNNYINVNLKNITIQHVGATDRRCIDVRGYLKSLTIENSTLTTIETVENSAYRPQPLTIMPSTSNQVGFITINLINSNIIASEDANVGYGIALYSPVYLNLSGGTVKGLSNIHMKAADNSLSTKGVSGSIINITGAQLISKNTNTPWSLVYVEDDNITVNIRDSDIDVEGGNGIASFKKSNNTKPVNAKVYLKSGNNVYLEGDYGSGYPFVLSTGATSNIVIEGGTYNTDPSDYVGNDFFAAYNGNRTWTVYARSDKQIVASAPLVDEDYNGRGNQYFINLDDAIVVAKYYTNFGEIPTLDLLDDIEVNSPIVIDFPVYFNGNGHTIIGNVSTGILIDDYDDERGNGLFIDDLTITGGDNLQTVIEIGENVGGDVHLSNVKLWGKNYGVVVRGGNENYAMIISGGYIESEGTGILYDGSAQLELKNNTVVSGGQNSMVVNNYEESFEIGDSTLKFYGLIQSNKLGFIYGGDFSVEPSSGYLVDGYVALNNGNGTWSVYAKSDAVARFGDKYYITLQAAIDAAEDFFIPFETELEVKLLKDITIDSPISIGVPMYLDGSGYKITSNAETGIIVDVYGELGGVKIRNLTLTGGDNLETAISVNGSDPLFSYVLTIENSNITASNYAVYNVNFDNSVEYKIYRSNLTGWIYGNISHRSYVSDDSMLMTIEDRDYNDEPGYYNYMIFKEDPTENISLHNGNYRISNLGGYYYVLPEGSVVMVNNRFYPTLQSAIVAAKQVWDWDPVNVELYDNVEIDSSIELDFPISLEGNGNTIMVTGNATIGFIINGEHEAGEIFKNLTITGGDNLETAILFIGRNADSILSIWNSEIKSKKYAMYIEDNVGSRVSISGSVINGWIAGALNGGNSIVFSLKGNSTFLGIDDRDYNSEIGYYDNMIFFENPTDFLSSTDYIVQSVGGYYVVTRYVASTYGCDGNGTPEYFTNLNDAIKRAESYNCDRLGYQEYATVNLLEDIKVYSTIAITGTFPLYFKGNGHTITVAGDASVGILIDEYDDEVSEPISIEDLTITGGNNLKTAIKVGEDHLWGNLHLSLSNVNLWGKNYGIDRGKEFDYMGIFMDISGGFIDSEGVGILYTGNGKLSISNDTVISGGQNSVVIDSSVTITGGTFYGPVGGTQLQFISGGYFSVDPSEYLADGYGIVLSEGMYRVVPQSEIYTVIFVDRDESVIISGIYYSGQNVDLPANPIRDADGTYTYEFTGWSPAVSIVTGNITYTAVYEATYIPYTVTFEDWDGSVILTGIYHSGDNVVLPANPTRAADSSYRYTFSGWTPEVTVVNGDAKYTATYTLTKKHGGKRKTSNSIDDQGESGGQGGTSDDGYNQEILANGYSREINDAYEFAYKVGITTMPTIEEANMNGNLDRISMAKMLSYYAINVLGLKPDTTRVVPAFPDVDEKMNSDYGNAITLAYQLGIMGINMVEFRPFDDVPRSEFVTALSRLLYSLPDGTDTYYSTHMEKLFSEGIITNTDPDLQELRGYVMLMLMRSAMK